MKPVVSNPTGLKRSWLMWTKIRSEARIMQLSIWSTVGSCYNGGPISLTNRRAFGELLH